MSNYCFMKICLCILVTGMKMPPKVLILPCGLAVALTFDLKFNEFIFIPNRS